MRGIFRKEKLVLLVLFCVFLTVGCESSLRTYLKEEAPLHKVKKIAIIPFDNTSKDKNAGEKLASIFGIELLTSGQFKVIEPGEVEKALKEVKVRAKGGVNTIEIADAQKIGEALGVDAIILGSIDTFEMGKKDDPIISMNIHMLDTKDGSLIWQADYIATGGSFAYVLDFGKLGSTEMLARQMAKNILAPIVKKSKNSLQEAKTKVGSAKQSMDNADTSAKDLKAKADELEIQAKDAEERAKDLEGRAKQEERDALKINPEALARKTTELQEEIKAAEGELAGLIAVSKKKVSAKTSMESKIKESEAETKSFKDKLDEITGQINIFTAKERVARIRGNNEEADDYKKKADAAKVEAKDIEEKWKTAQSSLDNLAKELSSVTPEVKKAQENEKVVSEKVDSFKATLAEVSKMQKELPANISPEQLLAAKQKEEGVKVIKAEAAKSRGDATRLKDMAEQVRKQADKARQDAEAAKKLYEDTKTKLE